MHYSKTYLLENWWLKQNPSQVPESGPFWRYLLQVSHVLTFTLGFDSSFNSSLISLFGILRSSSAQLRRSHWHEEQLVRTGVLHLWQLRNYLATFQRLSSSQQENELSITALLLRLLVALLSDPAPGWVQLRNRISQIPFWFIAMRANPSTSSAKWSLHADKGPLVKGLDQVLTP